MSNPEINPKAPESIKFRKTRRSRIWIWLTLAAIGLGGGTAAMHYPVQLREGSTVRVPLINYLKYKLFVKSGDQSEEANDNSEAEDSNSIEPDQNEVEKDSPTPKNQDNFHSEEEGEVALA